MTVKRKSKKSGFEFPKSGVEIKGVIWTQNTLPCEINASLSLNKFGQMFNISRQHLKECITAGAEGRTDIQHIPPQYVRNGGGQGKTTYVEAGPTLYYLSRTRGEDGKSEGGKASAAMQETKKADEKSIRTAAARALKAAGEKPSAKLKQETVGDQNDVRTKPLPKDLWQAEADKKIKHFIEAAPSARAEMREIENYRILLEKGRTESLVRWDAQQKLSLRTRDSAPVTELLRVMGAGWQEAAAVFADIENPLAQKCLDVSRDREALLPRLRAAAGEAWEKLAAAAGGEDELLTIALAATPGEKEFFAVVKPEVDNARKRAADAILRLKDGGLVAAISSGADDGDGKRGRRK